MDNKIFEKVEPFLLPVSQLKNNSINCSYCLKKDGIFVFSEGYKHEKDYIYGNILYYPLLTGHNNFFGQPYGSVNKKLVNGELQRIAHIEQFDRHFEIDKTLPKNQKKHAFADYIAKFKKEDIYGFFDHRNSLRVIREKNKAINESVVKISKLFNIDENDIGCTGSLSFGIFDDNHDDLDLVFYGTMEKNREITNKILELIKDPKKRVFEFNRFWTIRFWLEKVMICCFFEYKNKNDIPISDNTDLKILEKNIELTGIIDDDTHSIYMPPFIKLKNIKDSNNNPFEIENIYAILYNGILRGEFYKNDKLWLKGKLVEFNYNNKQEKAVLVTINNNVKKIK